MADERYEKRGRTARVEWLRGARLHHRLDERGTAITEETSFRVETGLAGITADPPEAALPEIDTIISTCGESSLHRIVASSGASLHRLSFDTVAREWSGENHLTHVEIGIPALHVDLALEWLDLPVAAAGDLTALVSMLARPRADFTGHRLSLHPRVTATLLAMRIDAGDVERVSQVQTAELDGDGRAIQSGSLKSFVAPPNRVRPSYRYPARRAWTHCALDHDSLAIDPDLPEAIMPLLQRYDREGARVALLVSHDRGWSVVELSGRWDAWREAIRVSGEARTLYPFAPAPQFGSGAALDTGRLNLRLT